MRNGRKLTTKRRTLNLCLQHYVLLVPIACSPPSLSVCLSCYTLRWNPDYTRTFQISFTPQKFCKHRKWWQQWRWQMISDMLTPTFKMMLLLLLLLLDFCSLLSTKRVFISIMHTQSKPIDWMENQLENDFADSLLVYVYTLYYIQ